MYKLRNMFDENGKFASPWRGKTQRVRLPYLEQIKKIAKIADRHPQPEAFLANVEKLARELAEVDGVNLEA